MPATLRSLRHGLFHHAPCSFASRALLALLYPWRLRSVYLQSGGKVRQRCNGIATMAYFFLTGNPCNAHLVSILPNCQRDRRTGCLIGGEVGPRESGQRRV